MQQMRQQADARVAGAAVKPPGMPGMPPGMGATSMSNFVAVTRMDSGKSVAVNLYHVLTIDAVPAIEAQPVFEGSPAIPARDAIPGRPSRPAVPGRPATEDSPEVPALPTVPEVPDVPAMPEVPARPAHPAVVAVPESAKINFTNGNSLHVKETVAELTKVP